MASTPEEALVPPLDEELLELLELLELVVLVPLVVPVAVPLSPSLSVQATRRQPSSRGRPARRGVIVEVRAMGVSSIGPRRGGGAS